MAFSLGDLYRDVGRYAEAEPVYIRALAILEEALDPDHPDIADTLEDYAELLRQVGRDEEAEPMEERARAIRASGGGY